MRTLMLVGLWLVPAILIYAAYLVLRRMGVGRRSSERLFTQPGELEVQLGGDGMVTGLLRRWLFLAGYRKPAAPAGFVAATAAAIALALAVVYLVRQSGLLDDLLRNIALLPSGVGDLFVPIAYLAPWMMFLMLATVPWLAVRRSRRDRVEKVEQDLPLSLELLSTLSEAGLGFDAALARVLDSVREDRPLAREFSTYQSDLLAGRTRVESFRRLARRLEISSVTILVSALVQAEQLGTGIAQALRHQADDLRDRRRERANAFAPGAARQAYVPDGDLLYAGHLRVDARTVLRPALPVCRHLRPREEVLGGRGSGPLSGSNKNGKHLASGERSERQDRGCPVENRRWFLVPAGRAAIPPRAAFRCRPAAGARATRSTRVSCGFPWMSFSWMAMAPFWPFAGVSDPGGWHGDHAEAMPYWR